MDAGNVARKQHNQLLANILNLNTKQSVKKFTRTEPTANTSEYNLIKSSTDTTDAIKLHNLTKSLKNRAVQSDLRKKVKNGETKSKTLSKPLEKPQAERLKRSVAYENVKKQLDRWDPVVTSNRVSTNLSFPLRDPNFDYKEERDFTSNWVLKSDMQKELEKLGNQKTVYVSGNNEILEQLNEKRKEKEKNRWFLNYREIKTRWKNKIKSKTFRRIERKQKIKEQMKEFEKLQITDPEAALKKLEEIEKSRAEERASLRHKSTGKWAKSHQIRAKYNKESRQILAEQLAVSKTLMQKQQLDESSDTDEYVDENINFESTRGNPYIEGQQLTNEVDDFLHGFSKFNTEITNKIVDKFEDNNIKFTDFEESKGSQNDNLQKPRIENLIALQKEANKSKMDEYRKFDAEITDKAVDKFEDKNVELHSFIHSENSEGLQNDNLLKPHIANLIVLQKGENKSKNTSKKRKRNSKTANLEMKNNNKKTKSSNKVQTNLEVDSTSEVWEVTPLTNVTIDDIFDSIELKINKKVGEKYEKIKSKLNNTADTPKKKKKATKENRTNNKNKLIKNESVTKLAKSGLHEESLQNNNKNTIEQNNTDIKKLQKVIEAKPKNNTTKPTIISDIQPVNTQMALKSNLMSQNGKELDIPIETLIFQDDDIVDEFIKDKNEEIKKNTPSDIDLTLPGWGSWGGTNIKTSKRKKKRFIIKLPKAMPRKDMNVGNLIINETDTNIKSHMVNEVPFPFKTVKDFESSIRAPIGNTFIPETAFRRMIKPTLQTRMGATIEPITEDILLRKKTKK